jgi:uncharacterized glyoxalase superfamily protein PhnB
MQVSHVGAAFAAADPSAAGKWLARHLGFEVLADLGWYVNTQHPDREGLFVDFVRDDDETWVERPAGVQGALLALAVPDVDAQHDRLAAEGVAVVKALVTEPWGQRRFQVAGPDGLVVELLQLVEPDPEWMAAQGLSG